MYIINNNEFPSALDRYKEFHVPFKLDIENRAEKVNEMIEEIDKYYNIDKDSTLKKLIRDMIESRIKFIESYAKFSEWYKKNR